MQPAGWWEGTRNQNARGRKWEVAAASGLNDGLGAGRVIARQRQEILIDSTLVLSQIENEFCDDF